MPKKKCKGDDIRNWRAFALIHPPTSPIKLPSFHLWYSTIRRCTTNQGGKGSSRWPGSMFAQASKRSSPQDAYRLSLSCLEGLQLRFLCPAVFGQPICSRSTSSITQIRAGRSSTHSRTRPVMQTLSNESPHRRSLASAATIEHRLQYDGYVPWEESTATDHSYRQALNRQDLTSSPVFDPDSSPIIIKDSLAVHPRRFRSTKHAVGGNINEIHGTLHACLQVGLFERAASLVRRLGEIYKPDAPGLLDAHNQYVAELSRRIVRNKDQQLLQHLQHWFQVDLVDAGVRADQTTYAMMIHASLERTDGRKDRTVRRYFHLAKEAGLTKETKEVLSVIGLGDPVCIFGG